MKNEEKIEKVYQTSALGFPVIIHNVKYRKINDKWCPLIKWNRLMDMAIIALITKPSRLTGGEIKFIRTYFNLSYRAFAEKFEITATAVQKWEKKRNRQTDMRLTAERNVRLFILNELFPTHIKDNDRFRKLVTIILTEHFNDERKPLEFQNNRLVA